MSRAKVFRTNKEGCVEFLQQDCRSWSGNPESALTVSEEDAQSHRRVLHSKDKDGPGGPFEYDHTIEC
jgi:hypothetical protein